MSAKRRNRRCPDCPFCAPSGRCLDPRIRSGRCGDWVWYVLPGNNQCRRLWVKPRDPRTPSQRHWRKRLGAASRNYSQSLTDEQQDACIAAGAKRRSRPRLGQWGWLTGQQFWVGEQCAGKAAGGVQKAESLTKGLQTKGISLPTWDTHRGMSVTPPYQHRRDTGQARKEEGRRKNAERRGLNVMAASEVRRDQLLTRRLLSLSLPHGVWCPPVRESWAPRGPRRRSPSRHRCAGGGWAARVQTDWRRRQGAVGRERGPPEHAKSEIRRPKAERRSKPETRRSRPAVVECHVFGSPTQRGPAKSKPSPAGLPGLVDRLEYGMVRIVALRIEMTWRVPKGAKAARGCFEGVTSLITTNK